MQARYYDPVIGRFYSNDPVGFTGDVTSFNRYSYVGNNPYKYTDPDGKNRLLVIIAKAAGNSLRKNIRGAKKFLRDNGVMAPVPTGPPVHLSENDVPVSSDEGSFDTEHVGSNPSVGEPNSCSDCNNRSGKKKQRRYYGPDGKPIKDIDIDHPHDGMQPHVHDWVPDEDGGYPDRQEPREPEDGEMDEI
jgi:uncharacterized protein RhaS with RHS repeats